MVRSRRGGLADSTAAINNLRRLGARRSPAREETQRIEDALARLLEYGGFTTLLNWKPPRGEEDPGEVDVIATLGQHLFVLAVKLTFMRRSQQEARLHASKTLRKAGRELQRKLAAMSQAIGSDLEFRNPLGLTEPPARQQQHGWIVDTCIECDHHRLAGFLKVSIEEVLTRLATTVISSTIPMACFPGPVTRTSQSKAMRIVPPERCIQRASALSASLK